MAQDPRPRKPRNTKPEVEESATKPNPKDLFGLIRDGAMFLAGLLGVIHETLLKDADRPTLLLLFATMMGLPAFFPKEK